MLEMFGFEASVPMHTFEYRLKPEPTEQHWHSFYEIGFCLEGRGTFYIGDEAVPIEAGTLLLFPPYEPHIAVADARTGCRCAFVYFGDELLPAEHRSLLHAFVRTCVWAEADLRPMLRGLSSLTDFFRFLITEYESRRSEYGAVLRARMLELSAWLYRAAEALYSHEASRERRDALERLKPALDYMADRYHEPLELKDIAELLNLSESRARHLFKEGVGRRFKEYLTLVRIQEAKRLLATSKLSVTEVILSCGFQSSAPFYRSFQQLVGVNPQQYRMRQQEEKDSRF